MSRPTSSRPKLVVIDAMSLVHRAYHAVPSSFSTSQGEPTNAVYGFVNILFRVIDQLKPEYGVVAFDGPGKTFRDIRFKEYKANRETTPDDLIVQFDRVRQVVDAFGIPNFQVEGFEADDILGFMAKKGVELGLNVILVTGDRDAYQLINDDVSVLTTNPRTGEPIYYDAEKVRERWDGLEPSQIVDLKALQGDSSDNIPGVPGIGEKTAVELLNKYGDLEGIMAHLDELPARAKKALETDEARKLAELSRELATIVTDLPIEFDLDSARLWRADAERVRLLFGQLEFRSLLNRLPFASPSDSTDSRQMDLFARPQDESSPTQTVADSAAVKELVEVLAKADRVGVMAVARETVEGLELVGMGLALEDGRTWYLPAIAREGESAGGALPALATWLGDASCRKIAHDAKTVLRSLAIRGMRAEGFDFDTNVAAYLLSAGQQLETVDALALSRLQIELDPTESEWPRGQGLAGIDSARLPAAAGSRALVTLALAKELESEIRRLDLWQLFEDVEMPLVAILAEMEERGLQLDSERLRAMSDEFGAEMTKLQGEIFKDVGHEFNVNSPKQLGEVLFDELRLPTGRKTKTGYSTAANVLEELRHAHPAVGNILEFRELGKLKSTYVDALPKLVNPRTGRIHTTFSQTVAATGRLSSRNPNLQNIPVRDERGRRIRMAFVAPDKRKVLLAADYSQIELRVLAHLCGDSSMIAAFEADEDIHTATAAQMFDAPLEGVTPDMRRVAKTTNFGIIYGITDMGLAMRTDLTRQQAADLIESYFRKYPAIRGYMDSTIATAYAQGYVSTLLNRRRYLPELHSRDYNRRQAAERMAVNMPVQGTAADIMKIAMIQVRAELRKRNMDAAMLLQVHDELLFEVRQEDVNGLAALAVDVMRSAFDLRVPLKVDVKVGRNWGEMEPV